MNQHTVTRDLSDLEREILNGIPTSGYANTKAFVVWASTKDTGRIEVGPVRWKHTLDGTTYYSCSPFPGAWCHVPEAAILRVSAPGALVDPRTAGEIIDRHNEYADKWCEGRGVTHRPAAQVSRLKDGDGTEYEIVDGRLFRRMPFASGWTPA